MRVPVDIRGIAVDGSTLEESTHTGMIGVQGAMILTSRLFEVGTELEITNGFSQQTARFRVAWVKGEKQAELWETGVESLGPLDGFWGVRFPPKSGTHR